MNAPDGHVNPEAAEQRPGDSRTWAGFVLVLVVLLTGVAWWVQSERSKEVSAMPLSVDRRSLEQCEGLFFTKGEREPFSGLVLDSYDGGQVKLRTTVVDGRLSGESMGWYTNGAVELLEFFENGQPHGPRLCWHMNGQLKSEGTLVRGRQDGVYRQWDEQGTLRAEAVFHDGKPHGLSRAWDADGSLKVEAFLEHGEVRSRHVYPDDSRPDSHGLASEESRWRREQTK